MATPELIGVASGKPCLAGKAPKLSRLYGATETGYPHA